jgi:spore germination cell wall hydrolase CwlJ-like protein
VPKRRRTSKHQNGTSRRDRFLGLAFIILMLLGESSGRAPSYQEKAVAAVLMGEAWGEGTLGMTAVGEVIRERANRLKRTPLRIVTTGKNGFHAFSCLNGTDIDALIGKFEKAPEYRKALKVSRMVCRFPSQLPGITHGATHFVISTELPYWAEGYEPVVVIGAHAFYRLPWI